jgi:proline iminopeptidase
MDSAPDRAPAHAWQVLHPPVQPYGQDWLSVGDGHRLYWEQSGHPGAPVALFLHGGPGMGCSGEDRRWFDPRQWRTVLLDQRGCGRSLSERGPLVANTTAHLVADLEVLRQHLRITQWMLFGGSWGSTLALAYAQAHPQRVLGLVLRGVFLGTLAESQWLYGDDGAALRHPGAWRCLRQAAGAAPGQPLLEAMHTRLLANDEAALTAAQAWWRWEEVLMDSRSAHQTPATPEVLRAARVGVHCARARWFLREGQLLAQAHRLAAVPGFIVQGQQDGVTPPAAARALHAAWPGSQWIEVPHAGHASTHPAMAQALMAAVETLAGAALNTTYQETADVCTKT